MTARSHVEHGHSVPTLQDPQEPWALIEYMRQRHRLLASSQTQSRDLPEDNIPALLEQQCQRLEESFKRHIQETLPAAALYFLQCQEAKANAREMPLPQTIFHGIATEMPLPPSRFDAGLSLTKEEKKDDVAPMSNEGDQLASSTNSLEVPESTEQADTSMDNPVMNSETSDTKRMLEMTLWEMGEMEKAETVHSWYSIAYERATSQKSNLQGYLFMAGLNRVLPGTRPQNFLVHIIDTDMFQTLTGLVILANTVFSGFVASQSVSIFLEDPFGTLPEWWSSVDLGFTIYFVAELALRFLALRLFFFVERGSVIWNLLDLFVCIISVAAAQFDIVFLRLLRVVRLVRLLKVIVHVDALSQLRDLFYAVHACLVPLFWAVVFLSVTILMFSFLILQCVSSGIQDQLDNSLLDDVRMQFHGFQGCFKTLFSLVAGTDWERPGDTLSSIGIISSIVMPIFVVFVNIGIMNIVIGVFADASSGTQDRLSIAAAEIEGVANFTADMVDLVKDSTNEEGILEWEKFKAHFQREDVQAYLCYHGLDSSHVQLLYRLVDSSMDGKVELREFVIGMLRLRGESKKIDQRVMARVLMHGMKALTTDIEIIYQEIEAIKGRRQA